MKKKKKYKSPQIIVMDYEMEESCLDEGSIRGNISDTPAERGAKEIIPIVDFDSDNDWK